MARVSLISTLPLIVSLEQHRGDWTEVSKWSAERAHACANYYPHSINSFFFSLPFSYSSPDRNVHNKTVFFFLSFHICVSMCAWIYTDEEKYEEFHHNVKTQHAAAASIKIDFFFFLSVAFVVYFSFAAVASYCIYIQ